MIKLKQILLEISDSAKKKIKLKWKKENEYLTDTSMDYYINVFEKYNARNIFPKKDIFQYSFKELENIIDSNFSKESMNKSNNFQIDEKDVVYNENNLLVLKVTSRAKAIEYGTNYDWCISRNDASNMFYSYRIGKKITFYFIFNKELDGSNPNRALVLLVFPNNKYSLSNVSNKGDFSGNKEFSWEKIVEIEPKLDGLQDLLKAMPPTNEETEEYNFFFNAKTSAEYSKFTYDQKYKYISIYGILNADQLRDTPKDLQNFYARNAGPSIDRHQYDALDDTIQKSVFKKWCEDFKITYDGKYYNCIGDVYVPDFMVKNGKLKIQFGIVNGTFDCSNLSLITLKGCPTEVYGSFDCGINKLTTLDGCPKKIGKNFNCASNKLITLNGCPENISGGFWCYGNKLTTLDGGPKEVDGNFNCSTNNLITLEGSPKEIDGNFICYDNKLTTLKGGPEKVGGNFDCNSNKLEDLEGCPKYAGKEFDCRANSKRFTKDEVLLYCNVGGSILT